MSVCIIKGWLLEALDWLHDNKSSLDQKPFFNMTQHLSLKKKKFDKLLVQNSELTLWVNLSFLSKTPQKWQDYVEALTPSGSRKQGRGLLSGMRNLSRG